MKNNKMMMLAMSLGFIVSCTSASKGTIDGVNLVSGTHANNVESRGKRAELVYSKLTRTFDIKGDYVYKGEQLKSNYIDASNVVHKTELVPVEKRILKGSSDFDKYTSNTDEYTVTEVSDDGGNVVGKVVTFTDRYKVKVIMRDKFENTLREVLLDKEVKVLDPSMYIEDKKPIIDPKTGEQKYTISGKGAFARKVYLWDEKIYKYDDIKDGFDNGRVSVEIADQVTYPFRNRNIAYSDIDDYVSRDTRGEKRDVRLRVDGTLEERDTFKKSAKIVFGNTIEEYNGNYDVFFNDIKKDTIKINVNGVLTDDGFNKEAMSKLIRDDKLEFRTTFIGLEEGEKPKLGKNKVKREILKGDKVLASKVDEVFVTGDGINVGVFDGSFFDLTEKVEKRVYRRSPRELDAESDFGKGQRTHGATVIGSMIEELTYGDKFFYPIQYLSAYKNIFFDRIIEGAQLDPTILSGNSEYFAQMLLQGMMEGTINLPRKIELYTKLNNLIEVSKKFTTDYTAAKNGVKEKAKEIEELNKTLATKKEELKTLDASIESATEEEKPALVEKKTALEAEITTKEQEVAAKEEEVANVDLNAMVAKYKADFDIDGLIDEEDNKVDDANMFWSVASVGIGARGINPKESAKYLPKMLEENPNIKVINMSYGSDTTIDDYVELKYMPMENKLKAVEEYNNNPAFRTLILAWLQDDHSTDLDYLSKKAPGEIRYDDLYEYFKGKKTIDVTDYEMLLQLRIGSIESSTANAPELVVADKDVLFVRSQGNTLDEAKVDLTHFDDKGRKVLVENPDYHYSNTFLSIPTNINIKNLEESIKNKTPYKYDYSYRKNMLGSIGVVQKLDLAGGTDGTDNFNGYSIATFGMETMARFSLTPGMLQRYADLVSLNDDMDKNPEKYAPDYIKEIKAQLKYLEIKATAEANRKYKYSFSRAGSAMLWSMAANGSYGYVYDKNDISKQVPEYGSSFSAPRMTAVAGAIGHKYPWMTAQQIKQTMLTTSDDDFRVGRGENGLTISGIYGVDKNIGWGLMNKVKALKGPARFVKALTHEVGEEDFIANVTYGVYEFGNNIEGGFDPLSHMLSRGYMTMEEFTEIQKDQVTAAEKINKKVTEYIPTLEFEERELFLDAGLVKRGSGTLILSGANTYRGDTLVSEGTLVETKSSRSEHYISEGAKLKLDIAKGKENVPEGQEVDAGIYANVYNKGKLYSYSNADTIVGTYYPFTGSTTLIATNAMLSIASLDLSEADSFNIEVFKNPEGRSPYWSKTGGKDVKILEIGTVKVDDLSKIKFGTFPVSKYVSMKISQSENRKGIIVQLVKGGYDTKATSSTPIPTERPAFLDELEEKMKEVREKLDREAEERRKQQEGNGATTTNAYRSNEENELRTLEKLYDTIVMMDEEAAASFEPTTLSRSTVLDFDSVDLRRNNIDARLDNRPDNKKFKIFADNLNTLKATYQKSGDINHITGLQLGVVYRYNNFDLGAAVNYTNSTTHIDKVNKGKNNGGGADIFMKYNGKYVNVQQILSVQGMEKEMERIVGANKQFSKYSQTIISSNTKLEGHYEIDKFSIKPSVGLNVYGVHRGAFTETGELGFYANEGSDVLASFDAGLKVGYDLNEMTKLGFVANYTHFFNDSLKYRYKLKPVDLYVKDNKVSFNRNFITLGMNADVEVVKNLGIKVEYNNRINIDNVKDNSHTLNLGLSYQF